jgi:hypothetical protein
VYEGRACREDLTEQAGESLRSVEVVSSMAGFWICLDRERPGIGIGNESLQTTRSSSWKLYTYNATIASIRKRGRLFKNSNLGNLSTEVRMTLNARKKYISCSQRYDRSSRKSETPDWTSFLDALGLLHMLCGQSEGRILTLHSTTYGYRVAVLDGKMQILKAIASTVGY